MKEWNLKKLMAFLLLSIFLSSCKFYDIKVSYINIDRESWEKGSIDISFIKKFIIGKQKPISPDLITVELLDSKSKTIYKEKFQYNPEFYIDDKSLGNKETIYIKVCGWFEEEKQNVCLTREIYSSPKNYFISYFIKYPYEDLLHLKMEASLSGKRKKFNSEEYESIFSDIPVNAKISLYLDGYPNSKITFNMENGYVYQDLSKLDNFKSFYKAFIQEIKKMDYANVIVEPVVRYKNNDIYFKLSKKVNSPSNFYFDYSKEVDCDKTEFILINNTFYTLIVKCNAGYFSYKCEDSHAKVYTVKLLPWEKRDLTMSYDVCMSVVEGKFAAGVLGFFLGMVGGAMVTNDEKGALAGGVAGATAGVSVQACNNGKKKVSAYCSIEDRIPIVDFENSD